MTVPVVVGGAELAFRIVDIEVHGIQVGAAMPTGPWLADRAGTPLAGSLGVLVDDALGYALVRARPDGRWSVSAEITIDVVRPLEFGAPRGLLRATTVGERRLDGLGGHTSGTISDDTGDLVAVCSQRGRWIPFEGDLAEAPPASVVPAGATCVEDLLGGAPEPVEGGATLRLAVSPLLTNPLGNLHGGLSLCASDLTASAAVARWDRPWATESLRIQYLRPAPAGSDVVFTAVVRHAGRTRAVVEVSGTVDGKLFALAHVSGRPLPD